MKLNSLWTLQFIIKYLKVFKVHIVDGLTYASVLCNSDLSGSLILSPSYQVDAKVKFIAGGNYDADTPEGMMETMVESMDQFYSMNLSHETIKGINNKAKKGLHVGNRPP